MLLSLRDVIEVNRYSLPWVWTTFLVTSDKMGHIVNPVGYHNYTAVCTSDRMFLGK